MKVTLGNIGHIQAWSLSVKSHKKGTLRTLKKRELTLWGITSLAKLKVS